MHDPDFGASDRELVAAIRRGFAPYASPVSTDLRGHRRMSLTAVVAVPLALGGGILGALLTQAILAPPSAFGTWTATPSSPNPALVAMVRDGCMGPPGPDWTAEDRAYHADLAALPLVVIDQRGRGAVALFAERRANGYASVLCLAMADEDGQPRAGGGGSGAGLEEHPADGPLRYFTAGRNGSEYGVYTAYAGTVDAEVTQVTVERSSGSGVIATVDNGYFVAWWPGDAYATRMIAYGAGGEVLAAIADSDWDFGIYDVPDPNPGIITPEPSATP